MALWQKEFGAEWNVPAVIADALVDVSWHNDVCPSFMATAEAADRAASELAEDVRLWVAHPEPEHREYADAMRFEVIAGSDGPIFASETDAEGAVFALRLASLTDEEFAQLAAPAVDPIESGSNTWTIYRDEKNRREGRGTTSAAEAAFAAQLAAMTDEEFAAALRSPRKFNPAINEAALFLAESNRRPARLSLDKAAKS